MKQVECVQISVGNPVAGVGRFARCAVTEPASGCLDGFGGVRDVVFGSFIGVLMSSEVVQRAERIMSRIEPALAERFGVVFAFLEENPALAQIGSGLEFGSEPYVQKYAQSFVACRHPSGPRCPETVPDPMVAVILQSSFGLTPETSQEAVAHHNFAMGAENIIGTLLERYIADTLEPHGWVWCSGSLVKAVDFVKREADKWIALQVKNRDNSENSSSAAIRQGTEIKKWFRTFSRKPATNWDQFPSDVATGLSEKGFQTFVRAYLREIQEA